MAQPEPIVDPSAWGQLFISIATIAGFGFQYLREVARARREEQKEIRIAEERIRQQIEVQRQIQIDSDETRRRLEDNARTITMRQDAAHRELEENTEISRITFKQSNDINQKIGELQRRFDALLNHAPDNKELPRA